MKAFGFDGLKSVPKHRLLGGIQQGFHFHPLGQIGLPHWAPEPGQRAKLRIEGKFVFTVHIIQKAGSAGLP